MKQIVLSLFVTIFLSQCLFAQGSLLKRDNGTYGSNESIKKGDDLDMWEESVMLIPSNNGPCTAQKLYVYLDGTKAATDTIWFVGDCAEGGYPSMNWVWSYNSLCDPVIINYTGKPGWDSIDISNRKLHLDGYNRFVIQHRIKAGGPYFGLDKATIAPYWDLMNPNESDIPGVPGKYYQSDGNYMVRLWVVYDFPTATGLSQTQPKATFIDSAKALGIKDATGKALQASRVSIADWNNDGWDDIFVGGYFFQNNGNGTFKDVTKTIGINNLSACVWADIDNDGWLDCYAVNGGNNDKIWHNNGDGTFTDITASTKITNPYPTITPMFFDYDRDGNLDLYISNGRTVDSLGNETYWPDQLWHNKGDGTFENVTDAAGITDGENPPHDCWGSTVGDYNLDGWPDMFVATYRLQPDMLFENMHDGTFNEVAEETGTIGVPTADPTTFGHGIGCEFGDFNNDGLPDLMVGNLGHPDWRGQFANPSLLYQNEGPPDYHFTDKHKELGIRFFEMNSGVVWLDLDLDGNLDLWHSQYAYNSVAQGEPYRRSRMYLNGGPSKNFHFTDVTWNLGCSIHGAWTAVRSDIDNDGDEDIIAASPTDAVRLFKNNVQRNGSWFEIRLKGSKKDKVNADAYGTEITIYAGGRKFYRDLMSGGSGTTASQNSNAIHFGLGNVSSMDSIVIRWPNGTVWNSGRIPVANERVMITYPGIIAGLNSVQTQKSTSDDFSISSAYFVGKDLHVKISSPSEIHNATLELVNTLGQIVAKRTDEFNDGEYLLSPSVYVSNGVYFVRLLSERRSAVREVQVMR